MRGKTRRQRYVLHMPVDLQWLIGGILSVFSTHEFAQLLLCSGWMLNGSLQRSFLQWNSVGTKRGKILGIRVQFNPPTYLNQLLLQTGGLLLLQLLPWLLQLLLLLPLLLHHYPQGSGFITQHPLLATIPCPSGGLLFGIKTVLIHDL